RNAIQLKPNDPKNHFYFGNTLHDQEKHEAARAEFQRGLALDPDWPRKLGRTARAIALKDSPSPWDLREAIFLATVCTRATDDLMPELLDTRAIAHGGAGQFEQAIATAEKAIQLASKTPDDKMRRAIEDRLKMYQKHEAYQRMPSASVPAAKSDQ